MSFTVLRSPAEWRARFGAAAPRTTLSVGNFDGLHLGHQAILAKVVARSRITGTLATIVTFDPHPLKVLRPAQAPPLIETLPQRLAGMAAAGLDAVLVLHFDAALAALAASDFVREILVDVLHADAILVGRNFRFGCKQQGDFVLLAQMGSKLGFSVELVPPVILAGLPAGEVAVSRAAVRRPMLDGRASTPPPAPSSALAAASAEDGGDLGGTEIVVSSTAVRRAVLEGRVQDAARLLGRPFALTGAIEAGEGRGRAILVPTLNLAPEQELLPKPGVYVTQVLVAPAVAAATSAPSAITTPASAEEHKAQIYGAATNVGFRPTFNGPQDSKGLSIESHLFDFAPGPAPERIEVRFLERLRDERKFSGPDELRAQIAADLTRARAVLAASAAPKTDEARASDAPASGLAPKT